MVRPAAPATSWVSPAAGRRLSIERLEDRLVPAKLPPAPVFHLAALSASEIQVTWSGVSAATGIVVDEWVNGGWQKIYTAGHGTGGCDINGVSSDTIYYIDVGAYNAAGTDWASYQSVTTPVPIQEPAAAMNYSPAPSGDKLFGANGPSYLDVEQGQVGDCWLIASLAEVAAREPQVIKSMFTYDGTTVVNNATVGVYTVRFYDNGSPVYVRVDTELPGGGDYYDQPHNGVLWVALAEKAYAEANGDRYVTSGDGGSDSYSALNSGDPAWALSAITGQSANQFDLAANNLASAWANGDLIVLGSSTDPTSSYIVGDSSETHAYAVVGYKSSSSTPFTVLNPWGTTSSGWAPGCTNEYYGLFNASASFLAENFATMSLGTGAAPETGTATGCAFARATPDEATGERPIAFVPADGTSPDLMRVQDPTLHAVKGPKSTALVGIHSSEASGDSTDSDDSHIWLSGLPV
jgi:hypothetical protein